MERGIFLVQTRSQTKTSGTVLSKVYGIDKGGVPNLRPEKQVINPLGCISTITCSN